MPGPALTESASSPEMAYKFECWCSRSSRVLWPLPRKLAGSVRDMCLWEQEGRNVGTLLQSRRSRSLHSASRPCTTPVTRHGERRPRACEGQDGPTMGKTEVGTRSSLLTSQLVRGCVRGAARSVQPCSTYECRVPGRLHAAARQERCLRGCRPCQQPAPGTGAPDLTGSPWVGPGRPA